MSTKKLTGFGAGIAIRYIVNSTQGVIINPAFVYLLGYTISVVASTIVTIVIGIIMLKLYDLFKVDWFLLESLKKAHQDKNQLHSENKALQLIIKWAESNKKLLFLFFFLRDAFVTVIYFRKGAFLYDGFQETRIKLLFFASALSINIWWNAIIYTGFSLFDYLKSFL